jgi:uncharacterized protein YjbI with pentapeptide repeats
MTASCHALLFVLLALFPVSGVSCAFEQADLVRVKALYRCPGCDLSDADLTGINLTYADLSKANLSGANLVGVQLGQANLAGANLAGADLTGAKLYMTNLTGANLSGARLPGAKLYKALLDGADLSDVLWVDGKKCEPGSTGECVSRAKQNGDGEKPPPPHAH